MEEHNTIITKVQKPNDILSSPYIEMFYNQNGLIIGGCLLLILVLGFFGDGNKGKLATSKWGSQKEKATAKKKALKQMSKKSRNSIALYIGSKKKQKIQTTTNK